MIATEPARTTVTLMSGIAHSTTFSARGPSRSPRSSTTAIPPRKLAWIPSRATSFPSVRSRSVERHRGSPGAPSRGGVLICDGHVPDAANERRLVSVDGRSRAQPRAAALILSRDGTPSASRAEMSKATFRMVAVHRCSTVALPRSSRASTDTTGRPLVFQATVPGLCPLRAA